MLTNDKLTEYHLREFPPDVLIQPKMDDVGLFSMELVAQAIAAGEIAANSAKDEILHLMRRRYHLRKPSQHADQLTLLRPENSSATL
jgi:predicted acylesterase/phospholipase RssA